MQDIPQDAARAVLERLDELVALARRIEARLQHIEQGDRRHGRLVDDPDVGPPRRLTLPGVLADLTDAAPGELVGRAGAT